MIKTSKMATIGQLNRETGNYVHINRRVYLDEHNNDFVKINGDFVSIAWLLGAGRTVDIWF